jgi:hypothetical protein
VELKPPGHLSRRIIRLSQLDCIRYLGGGLAELAIKPIELAIEKSGHSSRQVANAKFCIVFGQVYFCLNVRRQPAPTRFLPEVRRETAVRENIHAEIILRAVAAPQGLDDPLIEPLHHEAGIAEVVGNERFLQVDRARQCCENDQPALIR